MAKEQHAGTVAVVYFICDDKDDSRKSAEAILRGLIHQIITASPVLIEHAMKYHNTDGSRFIQSFGTLWKVFLAMITDHRIGTTYVVLDALDECEEKSRNELLDMLRNYFHSNDGNTQGFLKVLMTSRPYHQIQNKIFSLFPSESANCIRLKTEDQGDKIEADISSFITYKVDELAQTCSYDNDTRLMVFRKLKAGADGMFLWVSLIMAELLETPADKVEETLNKSPADLDSLYQFLLHKIAPKAKDAVNLILKWVVFAPRPMKLDELAIACALKPSYRSASCIESSLIHGFPHNVSLCGPILKVQDGIVHLVHQSAKACIDICLFHESSRTLN